MGAVWVPCAEWVLQVEIGATEAYRVVQLTEQIAQLHDTLQLEQARVELEQTMSEKLAEHGQREIGLTLPPCVTATLSNHRPVSLPPTTLDDYAVSGPY